MNLNLLRLNAMNQLGLPYIWGAQNPLIGFDCSGLVVFLLRSAGVIRDDMSAHGLYETLLKSGFISAPQLGAISFYGSKTKVTHCGFCLDDYWQVEAHGDRSCVTKEDAKNFRSGEGAYVRLSQVNYRKDLVTIIMPNYKGTQK
jgi:cell wall-associated NlpC family hydrolase